MTQITAHYNLNIQAQQRLENDVFNFIATKYNESPTIKEKYNLTQIDILHNQDLHIIARLEPKDRRGLISIYAIHSEVSEEPLFTEDSSDGYLVNYQEDYDSKTLFVYYTVERSHDSNTENKEA